MWEPLQRRDTDPNFMPNPALVATFKKMGVGEGDETWTNDRYQVVVRYMRSSNPDDPVGREGMLHLSIHSHDRGPMRNWRHFQQIKNEVAGEERSAVEIFPPESKLVDAANEYHLWVLPVGVEIPFAMPERLVSDDQQTERFNRLSASGVHKGRQEPWEPGLTTGRTGDVGDPRLTEHLDDLEGRR